MVEILPSLLQAFVAHVVFLVFCCLLSSIQQKFVVFFHFGSLQIFGFLMFDFFALSWSSKVQAKICFCHLGLAVLS